jgi:glycosyltransferase involved in cell wall biosynthesis
MVDPTPPSPCSNKVPGGPARRAGSSPASPLPSPRIALAHDWIVALRGGERVLAAIADALPHPPHHLYTLFHNHTPITPAIDATPHTASVLNHAPQSLRRWLLPAYPAAVAQLARRLAADHQREPIDLLISTSSVAIKALGPPTGVPHLCYCHTPARYLWTQTDAYATADATGRLRAAGLALFKSRLQRWDKRTSNHVTAFIANSTHTQRLIRDAYDRDSTVIHPPVRTDFFTPDASVPRENFLLMVSALEPYKRVDLAIEAATLAGRPLIIIGTGSHEPALRALARDRLAITFLGRAPDDTVRDHMRRAHAFLMPQIEDFGITAVEAQACGTPVIATAAGGALDTVLDGPTDTRTGVLVHDPGPHAFAHAFAHALDRLPLQPDAACRANALRFSPDRFRTQLLKIITRHLPA